MKRKVIGSPKPCPPQKRTKGVSLQVVAGSHNGGWFISLEGRQLQVGLGHLSVLVVDVDLQVLHNRVTAMMRGGE